MSPATVSEQSSPLRKKCLSSDCAGTGFREYRRYPEKILAVTAGDVKRVAKKHVNPEIFAAAVVKPEEANHQAGTARRGSLFKPVRGSSNFTDCDVVTIEIYYD